MLDDYKKAVIFNYHNKRERGILSSNLTHPTPKKLRDECLLALKSRTQKDDEIFIKDFFNLGIKSEDYSHSIERFDADKLRPLVNFLKGLTEDPEPRNVELLAWLIGFEPRPYKFGVEYVADINPTQESITHDNCDATKENGKWPIVEKTKKVQIEDPKTNFNRKDKARPISKKVLVLIIIPLLLISGFYSFTNYWTVAYICDRGTAKKYHLSAKCPALKNCKNNFVSTTIAEAEKNGKTLCGWEK